MSIPSAVFTLPSPRSSFLQYETSSTHPTLTPYKHLLGLTESQSYANIRRVLASTLDTDRALDYPRLYKRIFATGLNRLIIRDDLDDHKCAFDILNDPTTDNSAVHSIDVAGPCPQVLYLAIATLPNLRSLSIEPFRIYGDHAIELILYNRALEHLVVRCSERPCIFSRSDAEPTAWRRFQALLSWHTHTFITLTLQCYCYEKRATIAHEMATIVSNIPNLQLIRIATPSIVSEMVLEELRRIDSMPPEAEIHLLGDRTETIRSAPQKNWNLVTKVDVKRVQDQDITHLANFKRLKEVKLEVLDAAEEKFKGIALENVERLHIAASPAAQPGPGGMYYELRKDCISHAVTHMPHLEDVRLVHCRVTKSEVHSILMHTGRNLRRFETSLIDQEESPSQRLLEIIESMAKFNPNLRQFNISDCIVDQVAERVTWGTETYDTYENLHKKLSSAREMLIYTAPLLDPANLFETVDSLRPDRGVVELMRAAYRIFEMD